MSGELPLSFHFRVYLILCFQFFRLKVLLEVFYASAELFAVLNFIFQVFSVQPSRSP